jgi:alkylhydroperoxidase family enzyme
VDERTALEFGLRSVQEPARIMADDVQELRDLGYSDADIVELVTTAGTAAKFANFAITLDI